MSFKIHNTFTERNVIKNLHLESIVVAIPIARHHLRADLVLEKRKKEKTLVDKNASRQNYEWRNHEGTQTAGNSTSSIPQATISTQNLVLH